MDRIGGGFLNIDKPAGWTSHDVVAKIRRSIRVKRVGHLGTLDPEATGVLPICFGKGTKLSSILMDCDKEYEAVLRLGKETETQDASGRMTASAPVPDSLRSASGLPSILKMMASFVGAYRQQPPMYSAIKINGVPLYKVARKGRVVERPHRTLNIRSIRFLAMYENDISYRVVCSKGTYIRTLCADMGARLGCGGHLLSLRRIRSGSFLLNDAIDLESFFERCKEGDWEKAATPMDAVLEAFPALWVKGRSLKKLLNGVQIQAADLEKWNRFRKGDSLRILDARGRLMALGLALRDAEEMLSQGTNAVGAFRIKTILGAA